RARWQLPQRPRGSPSAARQGQARGAHTQRLLRAGGRRFHRYRQVSTCNLLFSRRPRAASPNKCHPERSDPTFSGAPICGAPGREVEGSAFSWFDFLQWPPSEAGRSWFRLVSLFLGGVLVEVEHRSTLSRQNLSPAVIPTPKLSSRPK